MTDYTLIREISGLKPAYFSIYLHIKRKTPENRAYFLSIFGIMSKTLHLYKVQADGWREPEFAAACNQMEAIDCVSEIDPTQDCGKYTVAYIGEVHQSDTRSLDEQLAKVMERNEKLKNDLQRICEGKLITVEQIKSVYAASGILSSLNEKTDSDNLMALWATLKEWHKELTGGDV